MICEKTGAQFWSTEYGCYFYGDLYILEGGKTTAIFVLKTTAGRHYNSVNSILHGKFYKIDAEWSNLKPYGVVICSNAVYYGQEGQPI